MAESRSAARPLQLYRLPPRDQSAPALPTDHDCVVALKALAEDTRVRIVNLLIEDALDVSEIAARVGISHYNASKHLRVLREAGLLQVRKAGRRHLYALADRLGRQGAEVNVLDLGCCSFRFDDEAQRSRPTPSVTRAPRKARRTRR